jgi:exopolysaccharide production protein ExoY
MSFNTEFIVGSARVEKKWALNHVFKRVLDLIISTSGLILLCPLLVMLIAAVFVLQGRPIIYRHQRLGLNGKRFHCFKFRSMVRDADKFLATYLADNPEAALEWAERQKLSEDPRITHFGAFLRKSSLDELPQLVNVFCGDMSVVGPRPITADELSRYGESAEDYLSVRPGLTGPWQISGRSDCSYSERIRLDSDYIRNWTLMSDLKIVVKTFSVVLSARGSV